MRNQIGARYLHHCINRTDKSFNGIINIANRQYVRLSATTLKRTKTGDLNNGKSFKKFRKYKEKNQDLG